MSVAEQSAITERALRVLRSAKTPLTVRELRRRVGAYRTPTALVASVWMLVDAGLARINADETISYRK